MNNVNNNDSVKKMLISSNFRGILRKHDVDDLYLDDFTNFGGKIKITTYDVLEFFVTDLENIFMDNKLNPSDKTINKELFMVNVAVNKLADDADPVTFNLNRIKKFKEMYEEYLAKFDKKENENITKLIDDTINDINECFKESVKEVVEKVVDPNPKLTKEIAALERKLASTEKKNQKLQERVQANSDELTAKKSECKELKATLTAKEKEIKTVDKEKSLLVTQVESLNTALEKAKEKQERATRQKEEVEKENRSLNTQVNSLLKEVKTKDEVISANKEKEEKEKQEVKQEKLKEEKNKKVDSYIKYLLSLRSYSIEDIYKILTDKEYDVSKEEVIEALKRVRKDITLDKSLLLSVPSLYGIATPKVDTNLEFSLDSNSKVLDIMVIGDLHATDANYYRNTIDMIYDYSTKNSINTIFNLGDTFDTSHAPLNYEEYCSIIKTMENVIKYTPYVSGTRQYILGGNHDKFYFPYGIDPLKEFEDSRDDVLSMGYVHSYVKFNGLDSNKFGLHHCSLGDLKPAISQESYLNLFAHRHCGFDLNPLDGNLVLPALKLDGKMNGCCHLIIHFNYDKTINYVEVKFLKKDKTLHEVGSGIYKKLSK